MEEIHSLSVQRTPFRSNLLPLTKETIADYKPYLMYVILEKCLSKRTGVQEVTATNPEVNRCALLQLQLESVFWRYILNFSYCKSCCSFLFTKGMVINMPFLLFEITYTHVYLTFIYRFKIYIIPFSPSHVREQQSKLWHSHFCNFAS